MSYTTRTGLEKIEIGSENDTWGESEHDMLDRLDESLAGVLSFTVSGDRTLVNSNTSTDELHYHTLNISGGSGGRVILPVKQSTHLVRNGSSAAVVFTTNNSGAEVSVATGEVAFIFCDGVNSVRAVGAGGKAVKGLVDEGVAAAKSYADGLALGGGTLPAQPGNGGKFIYSDGTTASWQNISQANVTNLASDLTKLRNFAIAAAAIL